MERGPDGTSPWTNMPASLQSTHTKNQKTAEVNPGWFRDPIGICYAKRRLWAKSTLPSFPVLVYLRGRVGGSRHQHAYRVNTLTGTELSKESIDEQVHSPAEVRFCKVKKKGCNSALFWQRERRIFFTGTKKGGLCGDFLSCPVYQEGKKCLIWAYLSCDPDFGFQVYLSQRNT
jgi:hypothetical protein